GPAGPRGRHRDGVDGGPRPRRGPRAGAAGRAGEPRPALLPGALRRRPPRAAAEPGDREHLAVRPRRAVRRPAPDEKPAMNTKTLGRLVGNTGDPNSLTAVLTSSFSARRGEFVRILHREREDEPETEVLGRIVSIQRLNT